MKIVLLALGLIISCVVLPRSCFAQAANSSPDEWPFEEAMAWSGQQGIHALENFLRAYPSSFHKEEALERLVGLYDEAGDWKNATITAQLLLKENPKNVKALEFIALLHDRERTIPPEKKDEFIRRDETKPNAEQLTPTEPVQKEPPSLVLSENSQPTPPNGQSNTQSIAVANATSIVVALIAAFAAILAAYWQFVYKPRRESASSRAAGNSVVQAPVIHVSPNFNISLGNADPDTKLKEQAVGQRDLAADNKK